METQLVLPKRRAPTEWGGIAFMFGNLLFLMNKLNEMSRLFLSRWMPDVISGQTPILILIGQVALIIGYVSFYRRYSQCVSRAGKIALSLFTGGGLIMAVGHVAFITELPSFLPLIIRANLENLFVLVLFGLLLLVPGLIWFGVLNLRRPVIFRWRWLPLFTGIMGFVGFFLFSGAEITAIFLLFRTMFAIGLIGFGLVFSLEPQAQPEAA
jgi:hypothetical protein